MGMCALGVQALHQLGCGLGLCQGVKAHTAQALQGRGNGQLQPAVGSGALHKGLHPLQTPLGAGMQVVGVVAQVVDETLGEVAREDKRHVLSSQVGQHHLEQREAQELPLMAGRHEPLLHHHRPECLHVGRRGRGPCRHLRTCLPGSRVLGGLEARQQVGQQVGPHGVQAGVSADTAHESRQHRTQVRAREQRSRDWRQVLIVNRSGGRQHGGGGGGGKWNF
mmetsp:Transcript_23531/g.51636  ORF Transcript_23531/g.51636 Transcript_23531/m.51636 type:complete len:222 (+) Transcript_23531:1195-1860(+)